jgi:hypothetical protein
MDQKTPSSPIEIKYLYIDLADEEEMIGTASLREFTKLMTTEFSSGVRFHKVSIDEQRIIESSPLEFRSASLRELVGQLSSKVTPPFYVESSPLIILCTPSSTFAKLTKKDNPTARWGGNLGNLSVVYNVLNKYILWHEVFHILGAEDCYQLPDRGPTCNIPNCIMQYEPTQVSVGDWPFLCGDNCVRVRSKLRAC